jgi:hypothetical protein
MFPSPQAEALTSPFGFSEKCTSQPEAPIANTD